MEKVTISISNIEQVKSLIDNVENKLAELKEAVCELKKMELKIE